MCVRRESERNEEFITQPWWTCSVWHCSKSGKQTDKRASKQKRPVLARQPKEFMSSQHRAQRRSNDQGLGESSFIVRHKYIYLHTRLQAPTGVKAAHRRHLCLFTASQSCKQEWDSHPLEPSANPQQAHCWITRDISWHASQGANTHAHHSHQWSA